MQAFYVPQEALRQHFTFYFTGISRNRVIKQHWNFKSKARDLWDKHQGSQQHEHPNPTKFQTILGTAAQQNNSPLPFWSATPEEHFYPPYVILPLGIFPYSKWYFKDRVKATL